MRTNQFPVSGYDMANGNEVIVRALPSEESFTDVDNHTISGIEFTTKCIFMRSG